MLFFISIRILLKDHCTLTLILLFITKFKIVPDECNIYGLTELCWQNEEDEN